MSDVLLWLAAAVLLALSGLFSGLNIGLMMARPDDLKRKARQGDKIAARVYRYRKDGYYLIFCILLGNVGVNTAMSQYDEWRGWRSDCDAPHYDVWRDFAAGDFLAAWISICAIFLLVA